MSSSQTSPGPGSPSSSSLQFRLTRLEESGSGSPAPSSMAALQIPVQIPLQITHLGEGPPCCHVCSFHESVCLVRWKKSFFTINRCFTNVTVCVSLQASESPAAAGDNETITLNAAALQTIEILPVSSASGC